MLFRKLSRTAWRTASSRTAVQIRSITIARSRSDPQELLERNRHRRPIQTISSCPDPTCACAEMPSFPDGLEIDHSRPLNGSVPAYSKQLLICTGQPNWTSRIEEENSGDNLAADVKELIGRGGIFSDPYNNVVVTNVSFPPTSTPSYYPPGVQSNSAYILPSFKYIPFLPRLSFDRVQALVRGFLLPSKLHPSHDGLSPIHRDRLLRKESEAIMLNAQDVNDVLVLICGHGGRDARCGILGPILQEEFKRNLKLKSWSIAKGPVPLNGAEVNDVKVIDNPRYGNGIGRLYPVDCFARVGLISHIGGHSLAGNVVLVIPPRSRSPLAGYSIWYGRVTPSHVEGIITQTINEGKLIKDLFRGGLKLSGEPLTLQ